MGLNELELWHRRHEELIQEAKNERLARRLRKERSQGSSQSERRLVALRRATISWKRTNTRSPGLRAFREELRRAR